MTQNLLNTCKLLAISILTFGNAQISCAQLQFRYVDNIEVIENGDILDNPFAGGLNSGQYNTVDLDGDEILDLVIFDRTSNKINTFINSGSSYVYKAEFEHYFPNDLENWIVLVDYDCDGKKDLFTYTNFGIRIFRNISSGNLPSWELIVDPLLTKGTSSQINLFLNSTDIPGIADVDGDGDLDILVFNFATGAVLEFHQNFSIDRTGSCGALDFERVSQKYGDIEECVCNVFTFGGDPCPSGGRQLHSGGKTTTLFDFDSDGDLDLVVGQEVCEDIYLIENKGTAASPFFDSFTNLYPEAGIPVNMFTFPTSFVEDVNFDGLVDFIIAPNLRGNSSSSVDFQNSSWLYENVGSGLNHSFNLTKRNFLQDEMIDVGEFAYPFFVDVDGDTDDDLLIGSKGINHADGFYATLHFYRNNPTGYNLVDEDFGNLSSLQFTDIKPSFYDLNNDERLDLVFTGRGDGNLELHYILNSSSDATIELITSQLVTIDVSLGGADNPILLDIDADEILDLLIGRSTGRLSYFLNTGTNVSPVFEFITDTFLGLDFSSANSNLNLVASDIDSDGMMDLITTDRSGVMKIYSDFINNQEQTPQSELLSLDDSNTLFETQFGRVVHPAVGQYNNSKVIAIGDIQGGIRLLSTETGNTNGEEALIVRVFPVPSSLDKIIKLQTDNTNVQFEIFGISGEKIVPVTSLAQFDIMEIDLSSLKVGLYIVRFQKGPVQETLKFVLGDG